MSDENKSDYDVGIPLDELPPEESLTDEDHGEISAESDTAASDEPADLPDLFAPEELAEVGLAGDLSEPAEIQEDDENPVVPDKDVNADAGEFDDQEETAVAENDPQSAYLSAEMPNADELAENPLPSEVASMDMPDHATVASDLPLPFTTPEDLPDDTEEVFGLETETVDQIDDPAASHGIDPEMLVGRLENLGQQISELQREFEGKLKYDAHKDQIIDRLHSELQEYKQDILKKYVLSIVMDVVKVADDIRKWLVYFRSLEVSQRDPRKLFRYLEAIPSDLEDVFYWHGVKPFSSEEGLFDPARQRAIKKLPTDDPTQDKNVAHSIRPGYEWESKVIRQEMVAVYVYQEEQESLNTGNIDE